MKEDYSHISVILDRTGSMEPIRDDTIGGFNTFLADQKKRPGVGTLTLVQFDSEDPYEVIHDFKLISAVPKLTRKTYVPRAATPLLDAIGRGINDLEQNLAVMPEMEMPAHVVMLVVTDGQENDSHEFTRGQITKMINKKQEDGWKFVFLSADLDAIDDALAHGVSAASVMAYDKDEVGVAAAWRSTSSRYSDLRSGRVENVVFDEFDRSLQKSEKLRKK
ncbi:MAG: VWA domain-containing protein [Thermoleophilia bacterium]|nr:VWA domain-containing protein [Thermoleophilia bacterium]